MACGEGLRILCIWFTVGAIDVGRHPIEGFNGPPLRMRAVWCSVPRSVSVRGSQRVTPDTAAVLGVVCWDGEKGKNIIKGKKFVCCNG